MFSSRSFTDLSFTFRSIVHFELIFIYRVWCVWKLFFSLGISNCQAQFLKNSMCSSVECLWASAKHLLSIYIYLGLFLESILCLWSNCSMALSLQLSHTTLITTALLALKSGSFLPPTILFQHCFGYARYLHFTWTW